MRLARWTRLFAYQAISVHIIIVWSQPIVAQFIILGAMMGQCRFQNLFFKINTSYYRSTSVFYIFRGVLFVRLP